ncbi:hypothetical protein Ppa06_48130 [Planomonospora parontospora subsp. parontospora]|uniref:Response regulatory domain-containing protein n=2 Tax=Planomonospora parontospora TaxID=58119 RepID=A0AA37BJV6_9ACTN|nr:hypothetical protein GCM10010126_46470 [Planomonospora parontospora]GII11015.1 hypothetical protein Ppa06_48130 [Planomonospora parontospora subsp. parontospora]
MFTLRPAWWERPRLMGVFFTGLLVITAVLVVRDPAFGLFTPAPYIAVRLARELRPDVILMDLRMPGMDGLTAVTELARLGVTGCAGSLRGSR